MYIHKVTYFRRICERSRLSLSQLGYWHHRQRTPLQDEDHSGNDPRLVPGFLRRGSGMVPEWSRNGSGECPYLWNQENSLTWTEDPRCGTLSC